MSTPGDAGDRARAEAAEGRVAATITPDPLDPADLRARVSGPADGAVVVFVGSVRERNRDRPVASLTYEAYAPMAAELLARVGAEALEAHGVSGVAAAHRVGRLEPGREAVAVAVAAPHREAAFRAAEGMIEELKRRVPLWKKERYADGTERWLGGSRPPDAGGSGPAADRRRAGSGADGREPRP